MEVVLEKVTKKFGGTVAVDNVDLRVKDKEFVILLGPSGCGKTTTLRILSGLEKQDSGNIYIGGACVNELPPKDRNIGMVFQSYALYPHMTARDNLTFALRAHKVPKGEIEKRLEEVVRLLRIGPLLDRKPGQISGGERQRVALGRTIMREPSVFLMDEPLANLDAKLRVIMRAELQRLHRRLGATTIYVTHDQIEAMTMADRVAIMNGGRIEQVDTPSGIYARPENAFVGGFIGTPPMNMLDGSVVEKGGNLAVDMGAFSWYLSKRLEDDAKRALVHEVILGVRPEDVVIEEARTPKAVKASVDLVETAGADLYVYLAVDDKSITARTDTTRSFRTGEDVWFTFREDRVFIFDERTKNLVA